MQFQRKSADLRRAILWRSIKPSVADWRCSFVANNYSVYRCDYYLRVRLSSIFFVPTAICVQLIIAYFFWLLCAFCGISVVFLLFNTDNNRLTFFLTDHFWGSALSRDLMSMRSSKPFFLFMFSQVEILNH